MSDKPTSAAASIANMATKINAALATIEREVVINVTTVSANTQSNGSSLLEARRSLGMS